MEIKGSEKNRARLVIIAYYIYSIKNDKEVLIKCFSSSSNSF